MPKQKFKLSKKHERLIDLMMEVPTVNDLKDFSYTTNDKGRNAVAKCVNILIDAFKEVTEGTQLENSAKELLDKIQLVFKMEEEE